MSTNKNMRKAQIGEVAKHLASMQLARPIRVAVDGITAAGKTTLARELTREIIATGRPAVHISTNDYHNPKQYRHRNPDGAVGYYNDAYNLQAFADLVLRPLGPEGDRNYVARYHDLSTDAMLPIQFDSLSTTTIVVVDGSFLQSAPLAGLWDCVIWVETSFDAAENRAAARDATLFGTSETVRTVCRNRYHAACKLYLAAVDPTSTADIIFDNNEIERPSVIWQHPFRTLDGGSHIALE